MPTIDFFYDIASPYSYFAAVRIDGVGERTGHEVRWRPYLLGGVFKATDNRMPGANRYKAAYLLKDLYRLAERYDTPFAFNPVFPANTVKVQRMLTALAPRGQAEVRGLSLAFFKAYWVDGLNISDAEVAVRIATDAGFDGAALMAATQDQAIKDALRATTDAAVEAGAFGAPAMVVGDQLFWGADRLDDLEWWLKR